MASIASVSSGSVSYSSSSSSSGAVVVAPESSPSSRKRTLPKEDAPLFDVDSLLVNIVTTLEDCGGGPNQERVAAQNLASANPDVLQQLCHCRPSKLQKIAKACMEEFGYKKEAVPAIEKTLHYLSSISLLNSKYKSTVANLEEMIVTYLKRSEKRALAAIIGESAKVLEVIPRKDLESLHKYSVQVNSASGEINNALNLFHYLDEEAQECIGAIVREAITFNGTPQFPNCKRHYKTLCQNLDTNRHERQALIDLSKAFTQKRGEVQEKLKSHYAATETKAEPVSAPLSDRDRFFNENMGLDWEVGSTLLKQIFIASLPRVKPRFGKTIRTDLFNAINEAAKTSPAWKNCDYSTLYPSRKPVPPFPDFEEAYVATVWSIYTDHIPHLADIADLMKLFVHHLPDKAFTRLTQAGDASRALYDAFFNFFGNNVRLSSLKQWCETHTLN